MRLRTVAISAAVVLGLIALIANQAAAHQSVVIETRFSSPALGGSAEATVVLPPGYESSGLGYPVIYFLHGLPAGGDAHRGVGWLQDALAAAGRPAILVAPQGARDNDPDPEYLDWGQGRNWGTYVAHELPRYIDSQFRTIPSRSARALVGNSAGGYGAFVVALRDLDDFGVVESWSGYFHATDPSGQHSLGRGPAASAHTYVTKLKRDLRRRPTFVAFYVGRNDDRFLAENKVLHTELLEAHVPHLFRIYRGGHQAAVWQAHASAWLGLALGHLDAARKP